MVMKREVSRTFLQPTSFPPLIKTFLGGLKLNLVTISTAILIKIIIERPTCAGDFINTKPVPATKITNLNNRNSIRALS